MEVAGRLRARGDHRARGSARRVRVQPLRHARRAAARARSSARRACVAKRSCASAIPSLDVQPLRGNVNTRLRKLDDGQYDAIILAAAGLKRLGLADRIRDLIDPADSLPAPGQGALALECRADRAGPRSPRSRRLNDTATSLATHAERAFSRALSGSCHTPLAAYGDVAGRHAVAARADREPRRQRSDARRERSRDRRRRRGRALGSRARRRASRARREPADRYRLTRAAPPTRTAGGPRRRRHATGAAGRGVRAEARRARRFADRVSGDRHPAAVGSRGARRGACALRRLRLRRLRLGERGRVRRARPRDAGPRGCVAFAPGPGHRGGARCGRDPRRAHARRRRSTAKACSRCRSLRDLHGKRIIVFRGEGGRELLVDTLRARGARVDVVGCYRRAAPSSGARRTRRGVARAARARDHGDVERRCRQPVVGARRRRSTADRAPSGVRAASTHRLARACARPAGDRDRRRRCRADRRSAAMGSAADSGHGEDRSTPRRPGRCNLRRQGGTCGNAASPDGRASAAGAGARRRERRAGAVSDRGRSAGSFPTRRAASPTR